MSSSSRFVHLHNHSEYSLLDGAQRLDSMLRRSRDLEMPAVAVTDHGNLFGAVKFLDRAPSYGVKPIVGCELYVAPGSRLDRASPGAGPSKKPYHHLTVLATNRVGYENLIRLCSRAYLEGFYYRPRVDKEILAEHAEGLVGLSGCLAGEVPGLLLREQRDEARSAAERYAEIFGEGNFYLEVQDQGLAEEARLNPMMQELSRSLGLPMVATNDCHFLTREDHEAHDILICIGTGKTVHERDRMTYTEEHYFKSADEMEALFSWCPQALANTVAIAERCELELDRSQHHLPRFDVPEEQGIEEYLRSVAEEGFAARLPGIEASIGAGQSGHTVEEYRARLEEELGVITEMGFAGYFLIVWDLIRHAREEGIPVGPGRGSAAGSLVAYSLRITDIDPLRYDLLFERFLNPERVSMPDIDIDFCFRRRGEVIDYVTRRYGRENVCQIITFGTMAARAVLRDAGRALGMPFGQVDRIAKLVPDALDATVAGALEEVPALQALREEDPQVRRLLDVAQRLEGLSRHASTHAAGVVIAPRPITEFAPLFKSSREEITTQWAKDEVESIGLLKMDFLGLKTLTLISDCLDSIEAREGSRPDLDRLGLEDEETYRLFCEARTSGVFQFESSGMREILAKLRPARFEDLIALNALYRPGPLGSGMIDDFIQRRHGRVAVEYPHASLKEVLEETYGVIVYQEQVMRIASRMAGYSLGQADLLRRAMGKKKKEVMDNERARFLDGARARDVAAGDARRVFDLMAHFAGYGFNKSHSAAYALVAYQTAWLKAHYPVHFMAALLTTEKDHTDKLVQYVGEAREMGVDVLPPDVNRSDLYFTVEGEKVRFGLAAVKGVGEQAVLSILEARRGLGRFSSLDDFCEAVDRRLLNRRALEALIKAGALDVFGHRAALLAGLEGALERAARRLAERESGQESLFGDEEPLGGACEGVLPEVPPLAERERLAFEKETLGFYVSGHPLEEHRKTLEGYASHTVRDLHELDRRTEVTCGGLVTGLKKRKTRRGDWMGVFVLEDLGGTVETLVLPALYAKVGEGLADDQALLLRGKAEAGEDRTRLIADEILPLAEAAERSTEAVTLRLPADLPAETLERLADLVMAHRGPTPLFLELCREPSLQVLLRADDDLSVRPDASFGSAVEEILGPGSLVRRVRPGPAH
jgi:DNA polymerase-3 subunit alpha